MARWPDRLAAITAQLNGLPLVLLAIEPDALVSTPESLDTCGILLGCAWDYREMDYRWFDQTLLDDCLWRWGQPGVLLVTFHGHAVSLPLLTRWMETLPQCARGLSGWRQQCAESFDLLAAICGQSPPDRWTAQINELGQLAMANGFQPALATQGDLPHCWQVGRWAAVLNHCQEQIRLLRYLLEYGYATEGRYERFGASVTVPLPSLTRWHEEKESPHG